MRKNIFWIVTLLMWWGINSQSLNIIYDRPIRSFSYDHESILFYGGTLLEITTALIEDFEHIIEYEDEPRYSINASMEGLEILNVPVSDLEDHLFTVGKTLMLLEISPNSFTSACNSVKGTSPLFSTTTEATFLQTILKHYNVTKTTVNPIITNNQVYHEKSLTLLDAKPDLSVSYVIFARLYCYWSHFFMHILIYGILQYLYFMFVKVT